MILEFPEKMIREPVIQQKVDLAKQNLFQKEVGLLDSLKLKVDLKAMILQVKVISHLKKVKANLEKITTDLQKMTMYFLFVLILYLCNCLIFYFQPSLDVVL